MPLLRREKVDWPDDVFAQISEAELGRTVRTHRWKYGAVAKDNDLDPKTEPSTDHGHGGMFAQLADCQVLIAGGMGQPAYDRAQAQGMTVFTPSLKQIDEALAAYVAGTLESDTRRVHAHGHGHDHAHD